MAMLRLSTVLLIAALAAASAAENPYCFRIYSGKTCDGAASEFDFSDGKGANRTCIASTDGKYAGHLKRGTSDGKIDLDLFNTMADCGSGSMDNRIDNNEVKPADLGKCLVTSQEEPAYSVKATAGGCNKPTVPTVPKYCVKTSSPTSSPTGFSGSGSSWSGSGSSWSGSGMSGSGSSWSGSGMSGSGMSGSGSGSGAAICQVDDDLDYEYGTTPYNCRRAMSGSGSGSGYVTGETKDTCQAKITAYKNCLPAPCEDSVPAKRDIAEATQKCDLIGTTDPCGCTVATSYFKMNTNPNRVILSASCSPACFTSRWSSTCMNTYPANCGKGEGLENAISFSYYDDAASLRGTWNFPKGYQLHKSNGYMNCVSNSMPDGNMPWSAYVDGIYVVLFHPTVNCTERSSYYNRDLNRGTQYMYFTNIQYSIKYYNNQMQHPSTTTCYKVTQSISASQTAWSSCTSKAADQLSQAEKNQYFTCTAGQTDENALCECAKVFKSKFCADETCKGALEYLNSDGYDLGARDQYGNSKKSQCGFSCDDDKKSSAGVIIGVVLGVLVLLAIVVALVMMRKRRAADAPTGAPDL